MTRFVQKSGRKPGLEGALESSDKLCGMRQLLGKTAVVAGDGHGLAASVSIHFRQWFHHWQAKHRAVDCHIPSSKICGRSKGFTLLELIVTLTLAAIVLGVGVPSFHNLIQNQRLTAAINQLVGALALARSEAIKRGARVTLCKSGDGRCCATGGGYHQGWIVFVDANGDGVRQPSGCLNSSVADRAEPIIRVHQPLAAALTLIGNQNVSDFVSFVPAGVSQLSNGAFQAGTVTLCARGYPVSARRLVLGRGGRMRVERVEPASRAGC